MRTLGIKLLFLKVFIEIHAARKLHDRKQGKSDQIELPSKNLHYTWSRLKQEEIAMAEMYVTVNVYFEETDPYAAIKLDSFKPLVDEKIENLEERILLTLSKLKTESLEKHIRFDALQKMYPNYLYAEEIFSVSPHHHIFRFITGGAGEEFTRDFCFMIYMFEILGVTATVTNDDDDTEWIFKLRTSGIEERKPN